MTTTGLAVPSVRGISRRTLIGLAISSVILLVTLPATTKIAGYQLFAEDLLAYGLALALLTLAAGPVRTLTLPAYLATGFAGYFGAFGVAALVGRQVMARVENTPYVGDVLVMPALEEVVKVVPVLIVAIIAVRHRQVRPSATDFMLLAAWAGAGFGVHENGLYGRGGPDFGVAPVVSLVFPFCRAVPAERVPGGEVLADAAGTTSMLAMGHLVWSALAGLGLGIALLYGRRWLIRLVLPATLAVAIAEHAVVNAFADGSVRGPASAARTVLLGGWLSPLALVLGTAAVVLVEWRLTRRPRGDEGPAPVRKFPAWLWLTAPDAARRRRLLGMLQAPTTTGENR